MNNRIGWCHETCNPVVGCYGPAGSAEKPARCEYCYAQPRAHRVAHQMEGAGHGLCQECHDFVPHFHPERLEGMTRRSGKGATRVVFVGSMCDLWSDGVLPEWRRAIWDEIAEEGHPLEGYQSHYVVLTKRPSAISERDMLDLRGGLDWGWLGNLWVGVSATNQREADMRWMHLCDRMPPGRRVLCLEPVLGWVMLVEPAPDWLIIGPQTPVRTATQKAECGTRNEGDGGGDGPQQCDPSRPSELGRNGRGPGTAGATAEEVEMMVQEAWRAHVPVWMKDGCGEAWSRGPSRSARIKLVQERPEAMR